MTTDFPTAPLAPGHKGAGGGTVEKSLSASHTEILTPPAAPIFLSYDMFYFDGMYYGDWEFQHVTPNDIEKNTQNSSSIAVPPAPTFESHP